MPNPDGSLDFTPIQKEIIRRVQFPPKVEGKEYSRQETKVITTPVRVGDKFWNGAPETVSATVWFDAEGMLVPKEIQDILEAGFQSSKKVYR